MNLKQIFGLALLAIGVVLFIFSSHSFRELKEGKTQPDEKFYIGSVETAITEYHRQVTWLMVGGVILSLVGIGITVLYRRKR